MEDFADVPMSNLLPVDRWEKEFPTSDPTQNHMLLCFDGQGTDDYLGGNYDLTVPAQHDFDLDFYFASQCESLGNTPADSLSGEYLGSRQSQFTDFQQMLIRCSNSLNYYNRRPSST